MNKIKNFFKKNHGIILLISLILIMIFGIMYYKCLHFLMSFNEK